MANVSLPYVGIWLGCALLVSAWRGQTAWQYMHAGETPVDPARWMTRFQLGVFAAGATWGLLGAFFFTPAPTEVRIAIIMVLAGMGAGALGVFAVEKKVYAAFMLPMLLPLLITLLAQEQRVYHQMAGMGLIFIAACLLFAYNTARALKDAIRLKFAHEATLALLRDEVRMREQMSAELVDRETHMRTLVDCVPAYIAHYNGDDILTYTNKA